MKEKDVESIISGLSVDELAKRNDAVQRLVDRCRVLEKAVDTEDLQAHFDSASGYDHGEMYSLDADGVSSSKSGYETGEPLSLDPHGGLAEDENDELEPIDGDVEQDVTIDSPLIGE